MVHCELSWLQHALFPDAVRHICGQEVICQLIKLFYSLDVRPDDRLLFLENTNVAIDFCVAKLIVIEITQGSRHLVLALMVE